MGTKRRLQRELKRAESASESYLRKPIKSQPIRRKDRASDRDFLSSLVNMMKRVADTIPPNSNDLGKVANYIATSSRTHQALAVSVGLAARDKAGDRKGVAIAVKTAAKLTDTMITDLWQQVKKEGYTPACRKGCSFCCNLPVEAITPEVVQIADFVRRTHDQTQMDALMERIERHQAKVATQPPGREGVAMCPLNVNGECSVYEVRPLTCRGYHSLDVEDCKAADKNDYDGTATTPTVPAIVAVARAALIGLGYGLVDGGAERFSSGNLVPALKHELLRT